MCEISRQDDPAIGNGSRLFRRVHLRQIVRDENTGMTLISSAAFKDHELSVDVESILLERGLDERRCLENHNAHRLVSMLAGECRQFEQIVCIDPEEGNPAHGLVCGRKTGRNARSLRDLCVWVIPPVAPDYQAIQEEKQRLGLPD